MHKFFVPSNQIVDNLAKITGEDVKHIYKVLRLKSGDIVNINDCQGNEFRGEIEEISKQEVVVNLTEKLEENNESNIDIYLYQGVPKSAKMDLIVQKCIELGVKGIIPIATKRVVSSIHSIENENKKVDRWNRIAFEACKQSKRTMIPKVGEIVLTEDVEREILALDLLVVLYENENNFGIKSMVDAIGNEKINNIKSIGVFVGPEGGFEETEIEKFKEMGANIVTLGPRILRTETAGLTAISILQYELGDLGGNK
ncbi:16S rRNA (uracil(1498)-N(3))-methyltransferase [Clostridium sp. DL1XJH146]